MVTESFETDMVIDTDEALQNLLSAIEKADRRGPIRFPDLSEEFNKGKEAVSKGCPFVKL